MNASNQIFVLKRAGHLEPLDYEKTNRVVVWAGEGLANVSASEVLLRARLQFFDGISTVQIHQALIKSAADLISVENPDYQYFAARLAMFDIRKKAFGEFEPPHLYTHVKRLVEMGKYDPQLLVDYTEEEFNQMNSFLDHSRDMKLAYAAVCQMEGKYLVQDRVTGQIYESPQFLYVLIAACLFSAYKDKEKRMRYIRQFYHASSNHKLSMPTPIMSGVRTPTRQFSSCVLIEGGDSLDHINATASSIVKYVSQRAGIGVNLGMIRALGSPIRGGEAFHTGLIPFFKHMQTAVKSCSQGGVRGGAATLFYPLWHLDVESLLVLKNNRGVEENRARHLDYGVQFNKLLYSRLVRNEPITLFSPDEKSTPGLYKAFFDDQAEFERLYLKYEKDPSVRSKQIPASELFTLFAQERSSTGRIYLQNVDHCNTHGPFIPQVAPIRQSNLCLEIALPTKPIRDINDEDAEIALCTLIAFNLGVIEPHEMEELADLAVRSVDALFDYQDYPILAARKSTLRRRAIGAGVINFAYKLAKEGKKYSDGSANELTHQIFESIQYWMLKASMNLAKEMGPCEGFNETKYSQGILPIDTYSKELDKYCSIPLQHDWEALRADILKYGLRNSTVTALMPSETSSQISNATNGIEPPRGLVSVKVSKDGVLKQVVPEIERLKDAYELVWDQPNNEGSLVLIGLMQKFVDQSISANTNYDPAKFPNGKLPIKVVLKDILFAYKLGIKTLYYHNTRDGAGVAVDNTPTETKTENA